MATFNVNDIVGRTLFAKTDVPLKRLPEDSAPVVFTVKAGNAVGVVDTYLLPKDGRSVMYWAFNDANGKPFYAAHAVGRFDLTALTQQGVKSDQQKADESKTWQEKLPTYLTNGILLIGGLYVLGQFVHAKATR